MNVLLSIKPEYAYRIFDGSKRFEYRRSIFRKPVDKVIVYVTSPVGKVIGEFEIADLICEDVEALWHKTQKYSGITKEFFFSYFSDMEFGYAIQIGETTTYSEPHLLEEKFGVRPPQSFVYV